MRFAIQLMIDGGDAADETQEIISFDRTDGALSIDELGLTLEEAKTALAALQIAITDAQVMEALMPGSAGGDAAPAVPAQYGSKRQPPRRKPSRHHCHWQGSPAGPVPPEAAPG